MNHHDSRGLYDRALSVLAGGVNSSVRALDPYPFFIERGDGQYIYDVDGNRYLDYVMGYGPLLLGHGYGDDAMAALQSQLSDGAMYGAPTEVEVELAEFIARHVPSIEKLRFVNTGTEATASAVRLARGYTGRDTIVAMQGGYHGAQESTLASGETGQSASPSSAGIPAAFAETTITVPFNDADAVTDVFEDRGDDIAAVLTEPALGNHGFVQPVDGYLETLRELTSEHGALLIFDEVMTGFRIGGLQCAQGKYGVEPDLTTLAKVIGGGLPVGAIGGPATVMEHFTPTGDVFQSGTYNGHPLAMTAGLEMLTYAAENDVYGHLSSLGDRLRSGLTDIVEDQAPAYTVVGADSMFKVIFTREAPHDHADHCEAGCTQRSTCPRYEYCPKNGGDVDAAETERWRRLFWHEMKDRGYFLTANQMESQFLSAAHTVEDIDATLEAYKESL